MSVGSCYVPLNPIVMRVLSNRQFTQRAVESCLAQDIDGDVRVTVIDNGSSDGVGDYLRSVEGIHLTVLPEARGLHRVWNEALNTVFRALGAEYCLVVNNDVWLRPDTYRLLRLDQGLFVTGISADTEAQTREADPRSRIPHPCFSCFLIRREVWLRVGPFDTHMETWAGDGDYHLRMDEQGIDAYAIRVPFLHRVSGTLKTAPPKLRQKICQQADLDRVAFLKKWGFAIGSREYYARFRQKRENLYQATGRLA